MSYQEQIDKLKADIENLEKEIKREDSKEWKPKYGERYWISTRKNIPDDYMFNGDKADKDIVKYNKLFKTEEECQHYCDYRKALQEARYEFSDEEWRNYKISKYYIGYYWEYKKLIVSYNLSEKCLGKVHFKTESDAQAFIDTWHDEILKWGV